jgi:ABC-2 type transport system ATP-binding protein
MLLGLIHPHAGDVQLFGESLKGNRIPLLRQVGALVEAPSLYGHLTGRENLEVTRRLLGAGKKQIDRALGIVNLEQAAHRRVSGYSSGMRQRLGLALALLNEPELLILDEPTNGLDPAGMLEIRELVCRLVEELGVTVFLSSHLLGEVEQVATHIGIIHEGRLRFQGTLDGLHAQMQHQVTLGVDRPERAQQILGQSGWTVKRNGGHRLAIAANGQSDAAMINAQLVQGGVNVYHLNLEQPSLEDIFLILTGNA